MELKEFETESKELLNLMINSIYSNKEIFLRELISNASDALDKYKYLALTSNDKIPSKDEYFIKIDIDKENKCISISDNGVGMTHDELIKNLGTIAKSGSKEFINKLKENKDQNDFDIIGQFGVGFYSAFMVAKKVEVLTKSINDESGYIFSSEGSSTYSIDKCDLKDSGTTVKVYLKDDTKDTKFSEYLDEYEIKSLVKKYSDYVRYPIKLDEIIKKPKLDENNKEIENEFVEEKTTTILNSMIPLWKKNKKDVSTEELNEFYKTKFYDYTDPIASLYLTVEGMISYNALIYIPSHAPYDLYSDNYEKGLTLYSKGVFIKDKCKELVPDYLKFIKGLVDSSDLSLNISREMLQDDAKLIKIRDNIENKVVKHLEELKQNDFDKYVKFYEVYGNHLKFGVYSSFGSKKDLLKDLILFKSLKDSNKYISLKSYIDEANKDEKVIYYASGDSIESIKLLPELESFKKQNINVLLCVDNIDEFFFMAMKDYEGYEFKNINDVSSKTLTEEEKSKIDVLNAENKELLDNLKEALKDKVDEVSFSTKLVDSPVCITTKNGLSLNMEKIINDLPKGENEDVKSTKVLELNPDHELVKAIMEIKKNQDELNDYANLLYDEAMLLEGYQIKNKENFAKTLNKIIMKSLNLNK